MTKKNCKRKMISPVQQLCQLCNTNAFAPHSHLPPRWNRWAPAPKKADADCEKAAENNVKGDICVAYRHKGAVNLAQKKNIRLKSIYHVSYAPIYVLYIYIDIVLLHGCTITSHSCTYLFNCVFFIYALVPYLHVYLYIYIYSCVCTHIFA